MENCKNNLVTLNICKKPHTDLVGSECVWVWVCVHACAHAQSCLTLCSPVDCSPSDSSAHGISQARYWRGWPPPPQGRPRDRTCVSYAGRRFFTPMPRGDPRRLRLAALINSIYQQTFRLEIHWLMVTQNWCISERERKKSNIPRTSKKMNEYLQGCLWAWFNFGSTHTVIRKTHL